MNTWSDFDIQLPGGTGPELYTLCPQCSHTRKKKQVKCLSVNIQKEVWCCHHCEWRGSLKTGQDAPSRRQYRRPEWPLNERKGPLEAFSTKRGIPLCTFRSEGIVCVSAYMPQIEDFTDCIAFPYRKNGQVVNVKFRAIAEKAFRQVAGAEKVLYRQDSIQKDTVIITEGECFPGDAEVLTPDGWVRLDCYERQKVVQVSGQRGEFVFPLAVIRTAFTGHLIHHRVKGWDSITTPGHTIISQTRAQRERKTPARLFPPSASDLIPRVCRIDGPGIPLTDCQLQFAIAVSADAAIRETGYRGRYAVFGFKKQRKSERLKKILTECEISASITKLRNGYDSICLHLPDWVPGRMLPWSWLMEATMRQRELILRELVEWDGNSVPRRAHTEYSSKYIENAQWVQTLSHTTGRCSSVIRRSNPHGRWFKVSILHGKQDTSCQCIKTSTVHHDGFVYCLTVPSGALLIRQREHITVSGNCDALSCVAVGIDSVVSIPDGAPAPTAKNYSSKFTYLDQDPDPFEGVRDIVLAVDADEPGQVLQQELARRLGAERCRVVRWPDGCKDANDVLRLRGADQLRDCLARAQPCPVRDVVMVEDMAERVARYYAHRPAKGLSTGWDAVDRFYTIEPGQLTIITGIPSSGKSEWLDALILNLASMHGWRIAICSPENAPLEIHCAKLLEKHVGKPFWAGPTPRMLSGELVAGLQWLHDHIAFIASEDSLSIAGALDRASALVRRLGIRGLVLDPFNEFDHTREKGMTETEYINLALGQMKRWARKHQAHLWLVAHPQKLYRREDGSYPIPTPYDISGSAAFRNKADNCITVWRDMDQPELPAQIYIQKVRFKHLGSVGMAELLWDRATGRYLPVPSTAREDSGRYSR